MFKALLRLLMGIFMSEPKEETEDQGITEYDLCHKPGALAVKYEVGSFDYAAIGDNPNDPGGKSYGIFQLSSNAGTLNAFINTLNPRMKNMFVGMKMGSEQFDAQWIALADDPTFKVAQMAFIRKRFQEPAIKFARDQGFDIENKALREVLLSIAVQHGGYRKVIKDARKISKDREAKTQIAALYEARKQYVSSLHTLHPTIKEVLIDRYEREMADAFIIYAHYA